MHQLSKPSSTSPVFTLAHYFQILPLEDLVAAKSGTCVNRDRNTTGFAKAILGLYENAQETTKGRKKRQHAVEVASLHSRDLLSGTEGGEFRPMLAEPKVGMGSKETPSGSA
ncbi:Hypothetical predicted protein [Lecanosticta acicola]|uniref:Uncharacterized protein n=1 Tax=Lecanosticta acicola TaxID=111012 RepID=A0AAI8Z4N2_9PEZI|nr:Hypothetical predicted protein [Lecanosticta acicola]